MPLVRTATPASRTCSRRDVGCPAACRDCGKPTVGVISTGHPPALAQPHPGGAPAILCFPAPRNLLCTTGRFRSRSVMPLLRDEVCFPSLGLRNAFQGRDEGRSARRGAFSKIAAALGRMVPAPKEDGGQAGARSHHSVTCRASPWPSVAGVAGSECARPRSRAG